MGANILPLVASPGHPVTIPAGFSWASVLPDTDASYTVTNSLGGDIPNVGLKTSPAISTAMSISDFPGGFNQHIITAISGNVTVIYVNGN